MTVAIIGAGVAGLSAATALKARGLDIRLFDKGRGPGGRLSTRRAETPVGEVRWDHGAQFFTARDDTFHAEIRRLRAAGSVDVWQPRLADLRKGRDGWTEGVRPASSADDALFVGTPAMNSFIKAQAEGLPVDWTRRVTGIERKADGKYLHFEDGAQEGPFDLVISAIPAEQAASLLADISEVLATQAANATSAPCWAVMLAFAQPVQVSWDAAKVAGSPLAWVARNASKPGREDHESWVLHATPAWSREHVDMDKRDVAGVLGREFAALSAAPDAPVHASAHRWLYAKVEAAADTPFGWDEETGVAAIGDWRSGPRVEAAWLSGRRCAEFLAGIVKTT